jgi:hypothetical protein
VTQLGSKSNFSSDASFRSLAAIGRSNTREVNNAAHFQEEANLCAGLYVSINVDGFVLTEGFIQD